MRENASVRAKSGSLEALFKWIGFDGDDCFRNFHIDIANGTELERFDFGDCAVWGLRESIRFFRGRQDKVGYGFRFPDIRTYDLSRNEDGFLLGIHFEAANRSEVLRFSNPTLTFDDEFLKEYDGDRY